MESTKLTKPKTLQAPEPEGSTAFEYINIYTLQGDHVYYSMVDMCYIDSKYAGYMYEDQVTAFDLKGGHIKSPGPIRSIDERSLIEYINTILDYYNIGRLDALKSVDIEELLYQEATKIKNNHTRSKELVRMMLDTAMSPYVKAYELLLLSGNNYIIFGT